MTFLIRFARLLNRSPHEVMKRIAYYIVRKTHSAFLRCRDQVLTTYPHPLEVPAGRLSRHMPELASIDLTHWRECLKEAADSILAHRFDLLGSGPIVLRSDLAPSGFEGFRYTSERGTQINLANANQSKNLRSLISANYEPIDWHLDFRSGFRWPADLVSSRIVYGRLPGVDIKVPWELARMQHMPLLALAYKDTLHQGNRQRAAKIGQEFQDQVLDFIASNPPRYGVNWACTMDVAIRIVNLLVAYDLFIAAGIHFEDFFEAEFKRSVLAHGRHIISNLEWFDELRSNHYLSNVAGLLFVAAYLPQIPETDGWLAVSASEICKELFSQFQPDGSNFEASTSYHRLSGEIVVFSLAIAMRMKNRISGLNWDYLWQHIRSYGLLQLPYALKTKASHEIDSAEVYDRLRSIKFFSSAISKPDQNVIQIGDNDSGRFLRLTPASNAGSYVENHDVLIDCINTICGEDDFQPVTIDGIVLSQVVRGFRQKKPCRQKAAKLQEFSYFGLYLMRSSRLWLSIRCGSVGQLGNGGHAHNDQLSIELCVDNVPILVDPGTYIYTAIPDERNYFRSTRVHTTLSAAPGEQNSWISGSEGLFSMARVAQARMLQFEEGFFVGEHNGFLAPHRRTIRIFDHRLEVIDTCSAPERVLHFSLAPGVEIRPIESGFELKHQSVVCFLEFSGGTGVVTGAWFSPGYGRKIKTQKIEIRDVPENCLWSIKVTSSAHA